MENQPRLKNFILNLILTCNTYIDSFLNFSTTAIVERFNCIRK